MTSQELVQEWNDVFPSAKISHNDIGHPTEGFLTNALLTLLRAISINVNPSEFDPDSNDPETIRKNKILLFQYVNELYRSLHNKKFHYFDFIHPTPKKTLNLLQTLLNYVLYYNMVEEEVATDAQTIISEHRELLDRKMHLKKEQEKNKIQVQHGQKTIESYSQQLDEVNQRIAEEKKNSIVKQFEDNVQLKIKNNQKLVALKVHVSELETQCINEDDFAQIKASIFEIQETLSEKQEALEKLTTNHESLCQEIASLEKKISLLETVVSMAPDGKSIAPGKLNEKKEELLRTMIVYEENKKKVQEVNAQLEKGQQELEALNKKVGQLHVSWAEKLEPLERLEEVLSDQHKVAMESAEKAKGNVEQSKQDLKFMQEKTRIGLELIKKSHISDIDFGDENAPMNF